MSSSRNTRVSSLLVVQGKWLPRRGLVVLRLVEKECQRHDHDERSNQWRPAPRWLTDNHNNSSINKTEVEAETAPTAGCAYRRLAPLRRVFRSDGWPLSPSVACCRRLKKRGALPWNRFPRRQSLTPNPHFPLPDHLPDR